MMCKAAWWHRFVDKSAEQASHTSNTALYIVRPVETCLSDACEPRLCAFAQSISELKAWYSARATKNIELAGFANRFPNFASARTPTIVAQFHSEHHRQYIEMCLRIARDPSFGHQKAQPRR